MVFSLMLSSLLVAQEEDTLLVETAADTIVKKDKDYKPYNALAPAKAAFYSAILPGLGQAYNGKYWKIPIAYAGLGAGIYFVIENDKQLDRYRSAYKRRLAGFNDDEFSNPNPDGPPRVSTDGLIRAQKLFRRNKELALLVTAGIYALNIIDANVDAHLQQFNVSEDLSLRPGVNFDQFTGKTGYGLTLNFNF
ncbi:DUF5683 domain-containing protein [Gillisia limnaea]|uniref:DUF5683 domain-containing protein n=1 Tax=Gillisia limnaea (strain DSM 15749 / LMG 21470 / R-8282) TaxID=865937 RepID=H2BR71_GILLR|nr:DUF5683 domain-containing protein [Gillisia limnaea]EHQ04390.1 hypothetical protein Gilli_0240 [Gillisia limnaea DSM 15749]